MRRIAWIYLYGVLITAVLLGLVAFVTRPAGLPPWQMFLALTFAASLMRVFVIEAPNHHSYEGSTILFVAGIWLLPLWLFVLLVVVSHVVEWVWVRWKKTSMLAVWYLQPFNMAKCIISGVVAFVVSSFFPITGQVSFSLVEMWGVLLTVAAYVGVNQLLLGLVLSLARGISFHEAGILRDALLIEVPLASVGFLVFMLMDRGPLAVLFALTPIVLIYQAFMLPKTQDEAMKALEEMNQDLASANQAIQQLNSELFLTVAKVFDARDPYVGGHAAQVASYAVAIARELELSPEHTEIVLQSAYLHDIGKIAIPEAILHKPARLTDLEYEFIKRHTDIGAELVSHSSGLSHLAPFIRHHHERWDGKGYPLGLAGEAIPLESRILNLCDSVEAMASDRPYHRAMSPQQIIAEVQRCAGQQFDPVIADAFVRIVGRKGTAFVVNSARSVAEQYSGSLMASGGVQPLYVDIYQTNTPVDRG